MLSLDDLKKRTQDCYPGQQYRFRRMLKTIHKQQKKGFDVAEKLLEANIYLEESVKLCEYRKNNVPVITYPPDLPIAQKKDEIIATIRNHQVVVICGETGSGKTTQLPKMCLDAGQGISGKIGCTQPRRIAATSIAERIQEELGTVADLIAYKIRFTSQDSPKCYIKLMTDGILLAETQNDRYLMEYDTIIIDEAHERSLNIDFLLGYLKQLLPKRPDLKIIISSATIDTQKFSAFFNNAPIIEVSGRMYPVEIMYIPLDKGLEDAGELTMIDATVQATELIINEADDRGDILIFQPAEQDIRETIEKMRKWSNICEVLPLFGRLSAAEQNKVFKHSNKRKIIVATNIAETSLTIPGIRYVIDSGYARISRYAPRTRTQRLPIEAIAQSSANQRKGRCGRVQDGICIRLYSEEDFASREIFTTPEIRRANLADVILRMISLKLGDVSIFPFLDPPSKAAIQDGFAILEELGAIEDKSILTNLGRQMARLPIEPRTARMLLEAQKENSLKEVLIIASALSIPDPKQRPSDKQEEADRMHQNFTDAQSDFVSFLNIWNSYQETWDTLKTQNKVRKFCNQHFLSYMRMREWHDIHKQLSAIMKNENNARINTSPASYECIHKAILSGFLSNICSKKENFYIGRANKEYSIFPGSGQYNKNFAWLVAAELVETSKLFVRTVAKIQPEWIEPLAGELCSYSYSNPRWDIKNQQVVADERVSLFGLVVVPERRVHYGDVNRRESRDVFISAIVAEEIEYTFDFLEKNQKLIQSVIEVENKIRKHTLLVEDDDLKEFYYNTLPDVVNVRELKHFLKQNPGFSNIYMKKEDIIRIDEPVLDKSQFPDYIMLGNLKICLEYYFEPADERDGVTLIVPISLLHQLPPEPLEWLVPGMLEEKIHGLLKILPKRIRKQIVPIADYAKEIFAKMPRSQNSLCEEVQKFIKEQYKIDIHKKEWQLDKLELYLQMRYKVIDTNESILAIDRDLISLQNQFRQKSEDKAWRKALNEWRLLGLSTWSFDELPESISITEDKGGIPYLGYPGLELAANNKVNRTLFRNMEEARVYTKIATSFLLKMTLEKELDKLEKILSISKDLMDDAKHFQLSNNLKNESIIFLKNTLLDTSNKFIRTRKQFENKKNQIVQQIVEIAPEYIDILEEIIDELDKIEELFYNSVLRDENISVFKKELKHFFPPKFLTFIKLPQLKNYPRYLKCLQIRFQRAIHDTAKDKRKWQEVEPYLAKYQEFQNNNLHTKEYVKNNIEEYRWMIEEFKISIFAQELKTLYSISTKRLDSQWQKIVNLIEDGA